MGLKAAQREEEEESERGPLKTNWDQIFFFAFGSGGVGASELKSALRFPLPSPQPKKRQLTV